MNQKTTILPSGFHDMLPEQAEKDYHINHKLVALAMEYGYRYAQPSMVQYANAEDTITFRDGPSDKNLAIRQDITPQIMRLATQRLSAEPRPLKLCYSGNVLRDTATDNIPDRQLKQMGVEHIGSTNPEKDTSDIILLGIEALSHCGIKDALVDISIPTLAHELLGKTPSAELAQAIWEKDITAVKTLGNDTTSRVTSLTGGQEIINDIKKLAPNSPLVSTLESVADTLQKKNISFIINPLERHGFNYHEGVSFGFYTPNSHEELGRGGWYGLPNGENGVGFSLHVNAVVRAI